MRAAYRTDLHRPLDPNLAVYGAYWNRGVACNPAADPRQGPRTRPAHQGRVGRLLPAPRPDAPGCAVRHRGLARLLAGDGHAPRTWSTTPASPAASPNAPVSVYLQTHHGTPLKTMGLDQQAYPALAAAGGLRPRSWPTWTSGTSASPPTRTAPRSGTASTRARTSGSTYGYPRNDVYCTATAEDRSRRSAPNSASAPGRRPCSSTRPTHRDYRKGFVPGLDLERLARELGAGLRGAGARPLLLRPVRRRRRLHADRPGPSTSPHTPGSRNSAWPPTR